MLGKNHKCLYKNSFLLQSSGSGYPGHCTEGAPGAERITGGAGQGTGSHRPGRQRHPERQEGPHTGRYDVVAVVLYSMVHYAVKRRRKLVYCIKTLLKLSQAMACLQIYCDNLQCSGRVIVELWSS